MDDISNEPTKKTIKELYNQLNSIQALADNMNSMTVAHQMPADTSEQIQDISQSVLALTQQAEKLVSEIEQDSAKRNDIPKYKQDAHELGILVSEKPDLSKMTVTELHEILTVIVNEVNRPGTSQAHGDYFLPLYDEIQCVFYNAPAQSPKECLLKFATLTEEDVKNNYAYGPCILEEASQHLEVA